MVRSITTEQAATLLRGLEGRLPDNRDVLIVEKDGDPVAVMISVDEYRRIAAAQAERDWEIIDQARKRNRDMAPDEIDRIVKEEIEAYRQERRRASARSA